MYLIIQFSNLMNYVMNKYFLFLQVHSDCNITICEFSLEEVIFKFLSLPRKWHWLIKKINQQMNYLFSLFKYGHFGILKWFYMRPH